MSGPFAWSKEGDPARLLKCLNAHGEARFVGGCVRDSLLGHPPGPPGATDIDVATTLHPQQLIDILSGEGVTVIPTGVDHGTVTAVMNHVPYEITTLRSDVTTDGRRATVAFTDDWGMDAGRRDFSINALYLSSDGAIFDYHDGQADLKGGRVAFIGAPEDRIKEDYLRILRFLRFSARFSDGLDEAGWRACVAHIEGLNTLSKERIWQEVTKLFGAARAPRVLAEAGKVQMLDAICPSPSSPDAFEIVHGAVEGDVSPALGLASLWPTADRSVLAAQFKPSNAVLDAAEALKIAGDGLAKGMPLREAVYRFGQTAARDGALWALGQGEPSPIAADWLASAKLALTMDAPVCPYKGADLLRKGMEPGPHLGTLLTRAEEAWIKAGFPDDSAVQQAILHKVLTTAQKH